MTIKTFPLTVLAVVALLMAGPIQAQTQGLANMSVLVTLPANGTQVVGFVVPGTPTAVYGTTLGGGLFGSSGPVTATPTALLVRTVGPTLQAFGIPNPAPLPHMRFSHPVASTGANFGTALFISYPGSAPTYGVDFSSVFASVGAFPLTGGEQAGTAYNYGNFYPGVVYVNITDDSGKGGAVLFELYVLSGAIASTAPVVMTPQ